jgi:hypothetical protein
MVGLRTGLLGGLGDGGGSGGRLGVGEGDARCWGTSRASDILEYSKSSGAGRGGLAACDE